MEVADWASRSDGGERKRDEGGGMRFPEQSKNPVDLNTVIRRAGAVAVEQLFGQAFQRPTQEEDERG